MPVRVLRGSVAPLHVYAAADPEIPGTSVRAAARPDRPAHPGACREVQGTRPGRKIRRIGRRSRADSHREANPVPAPGEIGGQATQSPIS
jgi:hypothetical protein